MVAELLAFIAGDVQQRRVEIADFAVTVSAPTGILDVPPGLEPGVFARDQHEWPFPAKTVMTLRGIGEVEDQGIVEHRPVTFGHLVELVHHASDQFKVESPYDGHQFRGRLAILALAMTNVVLALRDAQAGERDAEIGIADAGSQRDAAGQSADERRSGNVKLSIKPVAFNFAAEFVGRDRSRLAQRALNLVESALAVRHRLVGREMRI